MVWKSNKNCSKNIHLKAFGLEKLSDNLAPIYYKIYSGTPGRCYETLSGLDSGWGTIHTTTLMTWFQNIKLFTVCTVKLNVSVQCHFFFGHRHRWYLSIHRGSVSLWMPKYEIRLVRPPDSLNVPGAMLLLHLVGVLHVQHPWQSECLLNAFSHYLLSRGKGI